MMASTSSTTWVGGSDELLADIAKVPPWIRRLVGTEDRGARGALDGALVGEEEEEEQEGAVL